jgi:UDP-N-acetylmuramoyl-tripeptide--D-alanyl-D-alanine ligase
LEKDFQPALGRMNILMTPEGVNVIDDCYNANPESMKAALKALAALRERNRSAFAAGDMLELGGHAPELHRQLGRMAAQAKVSRLCAAGRHAEKVAEGARAEGMKPHDIFVGEKDRILEDLKLWARPGDWILVKGSRGMRMEGIVEGLVGKEAK